LRKESKTRQVTLPDHRRTGATIRYDRVERGGEKRKWQTKRRLRLARRQDKTIRREMGGVLLRCGGNRLKCGGNGWR
jgi:hypothetical protein